jgi:hypothetical protein
VTLGLATLAAGWTLTLIARTPWRARRRSAERRRPGPGAGGSGGRPA